MNIIRFVAAALVVAILGGLAGWYFFVRNSIDNTEAVDAARGNPDEAYFGGGVGSTYENITPDMTESPESEAGKPAPRLWHVTTGPVAGFGFAGGTSALFFAERATGNILRAEPDTSTLLRLTNTLVPKVHEALFSRTGDVVLRALNDTGGISSFAATIATSSAATSTPSVLSGTYLATDIVSIARHPSGNMNRGIFFIGKDPEGGVVGVTSEWKGASVRRIFTSPLTQWRSQWLADNRFVIVQNAADNVSGYAFTVSQEGATTPLLSDVPGLTLVHHPSERAYIYGSSLNGTLELFVQIGSEDPVLLPIRTVADKCAWAPGDGLIAYCAVPVEIATQNFLSSWYQGAIHTTDVWWKIEASLGKAERFFVTDTKTEIDVENPMLDESGSHIGFMNARDKTLWLLRVAE